MKPIKLNNSGTIDAQIYMIEGPSPYLGVNIYDPLSNLQIWNYLEDKDLFRLELAIKKCRKALKKRKK